MTRLPNLAAAFLWSLAAGAAIVLVVFAASGCMLIPGPDRGARVDRAQGRVAESREDLTRAAQGYVVAAHLALQAEPEPGRPAQAAGELLHRAETALGRAWGIPSVAEMERLRKLAADLSSELAEERRRGERALAARDREIERKDAELARGQEQLAAAEAALREQHARYRAVMGWVWRLGSILGLLALLWLLAIILPIVARLVPAAAPAARILAATVAPAVEAGRRRVVKGLAAAVKTARSTLPEVAYQPLVAEADAVLDEPDQQEVARLAR